MKTAQERVIAQAQVAGVPASCESPLGLVDKDGMRRLLRVSTPILDRIIYDPKNAIPTFRIGKRVYCRFVDLQSWIDRRAETVQPVRASANAAA